MTAKIENEGEASRTLNVFYLMLDDQTAISSEGVIGLNAIMNWVDEYMRNELQVDVEFKKVSVKILGLN